MKKIASILVLGASVAIASAPALAAGETRPVAVSYSAAPQSASKLQAGTRVGARSGTASKVDDGTTLILMAGAGAAGYFLHDIIDDDDNDTISK